MLTMRIWMSCRMNSSEDEGAGSEPEMTNSQEWLASSPAQAMRAIGNAGLAWDMRRDSLAQQRERDNYQLMRGGGAKRLRRDAQTKAAVRP